ncbi:diaminohydroxyphosphoribosylaminopyrimidine deaminase [Promicromonospora umidemergens]|uniref:CMP/dCMP-type deaminase domain-containing protein n=1 Tax=Promicromonospora umidemergens TaxID=629679 RepID=A0ABP8WE67_9MICO|nr:deaminase [Promicromonospora umidemergens]MCP2286562.1 diaminohydroxyphosphoribosylaminopyrimidine deaminase [Promicromonospora umidemergens]
MTAANAPDDRRRLEEAIALASRCTPKATSFCVGATIVDADGTVLATGYSGRFDPHDHAEETALNELDDAGRARLTTATLYTSLEPCSSRASRPVTCTEHILRAGIPRVVFALSEPDLFVDCVGAATLRAAGVDVIQFEDLAHAAWGANQHLDR